MSGRVRVEVRVRFSDVDVFGHVNNAAYLHYLEDARFTAFAAAGLRGDGSFGPRVLVMARQEVEHLRPLLLRPDPVAVDVWVLRVGTSSVDLGYEVLDPAGGEVYARARTRMVSVDRVTGRPRPLEGEERAQLLRHVGAPPPLRPWD